MPALGSSIAIDRNAGRLYAFAGSEVVAVDTFSRTEAGRWTVALPVAMAVRQRTDADSLREHPVSRNRVKLVFDGGKSPELQVTAGSGAAASETARAG